MISNDVLEKVDELIIAFASGIIDSVSFGTYSETPRSVLALAELLSARAKVVDNPLSEEIGFQPEITA